MVVLHPEMGRLWVWAWACLLVVGFAREARADDPGFLPVRVCVRPPEVPATVWGWGYPSGGPVLPLLRRKPWTRERLRETSYPFPVYLFDPDAPAAHTKQLPIPYRKLPCDPKPPAENKEGTEPLAPSPPAAPKAETKKEAPKPTPPPFVSPNKEPELPYSNKFGALAERGRGHTAIRVGDTVFDNFRSGGVPYSEFIADLGGSDFFGTPFVKVIEIAF